MTGIPTKIAAASRSSRWAQLAGYAVGAGPAGEQRRGGRREAPAG